MLRALPLLVLASYLSAAAPQTSATGFFKPTSAPFYIQSNEKVTSLSFGNGSAEDLQKLIDEAVKNNPTQSLVLTLKGTVVVKLAPLRLPSRINVQFTDGAMIKADAGILAKALVEINNARYHR